jgi:hypothetical protein
MAVYAGPDIIENGLVLHLDAANRRSYPGSGVTWSDLSGLSNNTTLLNSPSYNGLNNGLFSLDGTDDTVKFPFMLSDLPALSNFSIDIWVRFPAYPTALSVANVYGYKRKNGIIIGSAYYSGVALYWSGNELGTDLQIYGYIRGNDGYRVTSNFSASLNTWTNLTLVNSYSTSKLILYVNGSFYSETFGPTEQYNSTLAPIAENIGINKPQVDGGGEYNYTHLNFDVSNVKIYKNKALSAQEVLQNFNALRGRFNL